MHSRLAQKKGAQGTPGSGRLSVLARPLVPICFDGIFE